MLLCGSILNVLIKGFDDRALRVFLLLKLLLLCSIISARSSIMHTTKPNILIVDDFHAVFLQQLDQAELSYNYKPDFKWPQDQNLLATATVLVIRSKFQVTEAVFKAYPNIQCVARGGAGMDNIDEAYASANGITLLNAPEGNQDAVAEHTMGMLLSLSNQLFQGRSDVAKGLWTREANRGWEIGGKTIGIIGFGHTGSSVAKRLQSFGVTILAHDPYITIAAEGVQQVELDYLLNQSDVISFHVPLTAETKGYLNAQMIAKMKPNCCIINCSRGGIAQLADLAEGINRGKIKSLALDVLEFENPQAWTPEYKAIVDGLLSHNQVVITPHVAGWTTESYEKIARVLSNKLIAHTTNLKNYPTKVD
jgi:D-3-phosphoglycerate dehydrogenase